jgi:hypothetical protein
MHNKILNEDFAAYEYVADMFGLKKFENAEEYCYSDHYRKAVVPYSMMYNLDEKRVQSYLFRFQLKDKIFFNPQTFPTHAVKVQNGKVTEYYEARAISNIEGSKNGELSIACVTLTLDRKTPLEYYIIDKQQHKEMKYEYGSNRLLQTNNFSNFIDLEESLQEEIKSIPVNNQTSFFLYSKKPYGRIVEFMLTPDYIG